MHERVEALEPDLVAVTGDLVDGGVAQLADEVAPLILLCEMAADRCRTHAGGELHVDVTMVDFAGAQAVAHG